MIAIALFVGCDSIKLLYLILYLCFYFIIEFLLVKICSKLLFIINYYYLKYKYNFKYSFKYEYRSRYCDIRTIVDIIKTVEIKNFIICLSNLLNLINILHKDRNNVLVILILRS